MLTAAGYRSSPFTCLVAALRDGAPLAEDTVAITFDDGYEDFSSLALPRLVDHGFTATLFVTTGWLAGLGDDRHGSAPAPMLTWAGVRDAVAAGVEIGAHGVTHRALDSLDASALVVELEESKRIVEDEIQRAVHHVAYPFGYHNQEVLRAARRVGYRGGAAVGNTFVEQCSPPFAVPRLTVRRAMDENTFQRVLDGHDVMRVDRAMTRLWGTTRWLRGTVGRPASGR
jgi:peptidoglycan/xylan/chitin deacetylase (PgdA/CDA1 family)